MCLAFVENKWFLEFTQLLEAEAGLGQHHLLKVELVFMLSQLKISSES